MTRVMKRVVEKKCVECETKFMVTKRNARRVFCSNTCRWRWHNQHGGVSRDADARCGREGE